MQTTKDNIGYIAQTGIYDLWALIAMTVMCNSKTSTCSIGLLIGWYDHFFCLSFFKNCAGI